MEIPSLGVLGLSFVALMTAAAQRAKPLNTDTSLEGGRADNSRDKPSNVNVSPCRVGLCLEYVGRQGERVKGVLGKWGFVPRNLYVGYEMCRDRTTKRTRLWNYPQGVPLVSPPGIPVSPRKNATAGLGL